MLTPGTVSIGVSVTPVWGWGLHKGVLLAVELVHSGRSVIEGGFSRRPFNILRYRV